MRLVNLPFRLIAVLLLLAAALIATACESAAQTPGYASQNNALAAAAPTITATSEAMVVPEHTQTPTPTTVSQTATPDI